MALDKNVFKKGLKAEFASAYQVKSPTITNLTTKIMSSGSSEDYAWFGSLPQMRKMNGERIAKQLTSYALTIKNETYETTLGIQAEDIEDEQTGKYNVLAREIGRTALEFQERSIYEALEAGFTTLSADGQYLFDTDHAGVNGSQSNVTNATLNADNYRTALTKLRTAKTPEGQPMGTGAKFVLVVSPEKLAIAESIVNKQFLAGGETNLNYNTAEIVVNHFATNANYWYVLNVAGAIKPFVVQERLFTELEVQLQDSHSGFMRDEYYMGCRWRGAIVPTLWQYFYGSNATS